MFAGRTSALINVIALLFACVMFIGVAAAALPAGALIA